MDFKTKNDYIRPADSIDEVKDENMNAIYLEVVDSPTMTPALLHETETCKAMMSKMDCTMSAEDKSDMVAIDSSKTREFPDVSFDKMSDKENLIEEICPSKIQDIEIDDESIQLSRENPEVLSDIESERMDENEDAICNLKHIQDAFVFSPINGFYPNEQYSSTRYFSQRKRNEPNGGHKVFSFQQIHHYHF